MTTASGKHRATKCDQKGHKWVQKAPYGLGDQKCARPDCEAEKPALTVQQEPLSGGRPHDGHTRSVQT